MTDWTAGYVADIGYTYGYYAELNPLRIKLAFLNAGFVFPEVGIACELGFGQGLSANLHAAASVTHWYGTDFNPSQAAFAQDLAAAAGAETRLYDQAFAEFCTRTDLPDFDAISLHGIWSWISDENRAVVVDFIRRKLKVGGVLYISYNTLPGWGSFAPMRHLMNEHVATLGASGDGIVNRIDGALNFAEKLLATNPVYSRANPHVEERLKTVKQQNRQYLAHEYFNRDWHPMHFATVTKWLEPAKVSFACSARYLDHVDVVNITPEQQTLLNGIPDPTFRESVRDFMVNQQFRRDYWVKGARRLPLLDQMESLRKQRVMLVKPRSDVSLKVAGLFGEATLGEAIYNPILDLLADYQPKSLGQIEAAVKDKGINLAQIREVAVVLTGTDHLAAVQDEAIVGKAKKHTDRLNLHLCDLARGSTDVSFLASPMTGGGIVVDRVQQLFLLSRNSGKKATKEWAEDTWSILVAQGQRVMKDGKPLEAPESNLEELTQQAETFAEKQLPILAALGIA